MNDNNSYDNLDYSANAIEVLRRRYLLKDENQRVIETPDEMFRRVARCVSLAEDNFAGGISAKEAEKKFYEMMRGREFMPNSPTLMNADTAFGQLSACFVLPVADSVDGIFESVKNMAKIHQTGGGTGFSFSRLRPKGALVSSTKGRASGPVSFMSVFDKATGVIVQGGRRRGANMGILRCDHPDIVEFIEAKSRAEEFENFNLSVAVTDEFMEAVKSNSEFELKDPQSGRAVRGVKAGSIFDLIVTAAWRGGDPGLVFIDEVNRKNTTPAVGMIEATNPCGELPLLGFESCNLASINLAKMVEGGQIDWDKLRDRVRWGIRFLDDVIEVNKYPLEQIREMTRANRKVGLGVMGFADMLIMLGMRYGSRESLELARELMRFIRECSMEASEGLVLERGVFPNFEKSIYAEQGPKMRNATVNTIAPTGTISIIAGCSSGIEPVFALSFVRNVLSGTKLFEVNELFERAAKDGGFYSDEILDQIAKSGSLHGVNGLPAEVKRVFVTAFDVSSIEHLKVQAAFQEFTDNAVSKTINLSQNASVEDVRRIYLKAYELKCKGITIYRYGSRNDQVLSFGGKDRNEKFDEGLVADSGYSGGCAVGECVF